MNKLKVFSFLLFCLLAFTLFSCDDSIGSGTNPGVGLPGSPTNVSAAAASSSSITISWSPVSGASGYYIYRSSISYGSFTRVGTSSSTSYTNSGLSANMTYFYKVSAYNGSGESSQSTSVSATTSSSNAVTPGTGGNLVLGNGYGWLNTNGVNVLVFGSDGSVQEYLIITPTRINLYGSGQFTANAGILTIIPSRGESSVFGYSVTGDMLTTEGYGRTRTYYKNYLEWL